MAAQIHPIDLAIILAYLLITVTAGILVGRGATTLRNYFFADKKLPWWALLLSIVASETSTVTFLSIPGLAFKDGGNLTFLQLAAGFIIGRLAVAWLILPGYFRGNVSTSYEFLQNRLGQGTRRLSAGLFLCTRTVGDSLRLFLAALVLYHVINFNLPVCIALIALATILYTVMGGLRSVVWNDCIQFVVYMGGAFVALMIIVNALGGWTPVWEFAKETGRSKVFDWSLGSLGISLWAGLIGGGCLSFATHGTDHLVVQRLLGAARQVDAKKALVLSGLVVFLQFAFFLLVGLALACFYDRQPPAEAFERADEVFVVFITEEMPVGVIGLVLAALFAAAMSTQSSSLNSLAAVFVNDFYRSWVLRPTDSDLLKVGKLATLVFGVIQFLFALAACFWLHDSRSAVDVILQIAAFAYGPVLGLFLIALIARTKLNSRVGFIAFGGGLLISFVLKLLSWDSVGVFAISGYWFTAIGAAATVVVGWCTSLIRRP